MTIQTNLLTGDLVYATALKKENVPTMTKWFQNMEYYRFLNDSLVSPMTAEQEEEWYNHVNKDPNEIHFGIHVIEDETYIGNMGIFDFNWAARSCVFGIGVGEPEYWGKGYGTDATRVMLRYAFMEANMNRVALQVFSYNTRAIKSYEKIGFKHEGKARQTLWRDGHYYDMIYMSILREEWNNDTGK